MSFKIVQNLSRDGGSCGAGKGLCTPSNIGVLLLLEEPVSLCLACRGSNHGSVGMDELKFAVRIRSYRVLKAKVLILPSL